MSVRLSVVMSVRNVVMSVRNGERYLAEAIESILRQSRPPDEVVVVDDGSIDGTAEILAGYGSALSVVTQPPLGGFAGLNSGVRAATGDMLGFLDGDDLFVDGSLEARLAVFDARPDLDIVYGRIQQFISPDLSPEIAARFRVDTAPVLVPLFQSMLIRRRTFDVVGLLDESRVTASNVDWWSRALASGVACAELDTVVARRRVHMSNTNVTQRAVARANMLAVVRTHRHRVAGAVVNVDGPL